MGAMPQRNIFSSLRRQAREAVVQVLYQDDLNPGVSPEVGEILLAERLRFPELARLERRQLDDLAKLAVADVDQAASTQRLDEEQAQDIRRATIEFARELIAGVRRNRPALDAAIQQVAENWSLHRMAATDRSVLRLGAYELLHSSLPPRVAVDEAVELAKRFGTAQSGSFVNGILDRLMHSSAAAPQAESAAEPQDQ